MKITKYYITILFLLTMQTFAQTTIVNKLVAKSFVKKNEATRVLVQDSITKEVSWVLKSTLTPEKQFANEITEETGFTLVGQNLTMNPLWKWTINNILYSNVASQTINIPLAAAGLTRIDIIACNTSNGFTRLIGTESLTTPNAPPIPFNTLQATFIVVTDLVVEKPDPTITGNLYIPKADKSSYPVIGSGTTLISGKFAQYSSFVLMGTHTTISKVSLANGKNLYDGRILTIKNKENNNVTITHNSNIGLGVSFLFPDAQNYVLAPNEIIEFSYNNSISQFEKIGNSTSTLQMVTDAGNTTTNAITANSFIKSGDTDANILLAGGGVTALNALALDSNVVHKTGDETIAGKKTFNVDVNINGLTVGKGGGNIFTNTANGIQALYSNTTGGYNTTNGFSALYSNTTGSGNTASGRYALYSNIIGINNTANGLNSGVNIANGSTFNTNPNESIFLGANTKSLTINDTNQIVIGNGAIGNGTNTTTIGNSNITNTYLAGNVRGSSFIKNEGLSSQALMADGSVKDVGNVNNTTDANKPISIATQTSLNTKQSLFTGTTNYLPKSLTPTTLESSRIQDTGTFLGIGTVNAPTKDLTFGNQANREVGIEQSDNQTKGRDFINRAGRTINFVPDAGFVKINAEPNRQIADFYSDSSNNMYYVLNMSIFKRTNNAGLFELTALTMPTDIGGAGGIAINNSNGDRYICSTYSGVFKQNAGTGGWANVGLPIQDYRAITINQSNGDVLVTSSNPGKIYKQRGGTGSFVDMGVEIRSWYGIRYHQNGNIYAGEIGSGNLYIQTGGVGAFVLFQTGISNRHITIGSNGDTYTYNSGTGVWFQSGGIGVFVLIPNSDNSYFSMGANTDGSVYASEWNKGMFLKTNNLLGTPNLNGGKLTQAAGTGKGTGQSRIEFKTGQKTASGTDMQIETLRMIIDEDGLINYSEDKSSLYTARTIPDLSYLNSRLANISFLNIEEGNGIGFSPVRTAANYGNIGGGSLDLITSAVASSTIGTTGSQSIGFGDENIVNGYSSIGGGIFNNYQADYSAGFGLSNTTGVGSQGLFVSGNRHDVTGLNITVVGQAANVINSTTLDWNVNKPLFVVGNGTITNADSNNTVLTRSNAFEVKQDGNTKVQKDIEIETLGNGVILKSPDNSRWRITIDNYGSLTTTKL